MTRFDKRTRLLAAGLAAIAGYVDATGFLASKGFFVSFMSGNSTRLAVGMIERATDAVGAFALILLFVVGVVTGSLTGRHAGHHRRSSVIALVAILLATAVLLALAGLPYPALAAMALAMGAENAVFEADGDVQIGLTYMTGTLVKFGQRLATAFTGGAPWDWVPFALLWAGLVAGAILGAAAYPRLGLASLTVPAVLLAVLAMLVRRFGPDN